MIAWLYRFGVGIFIIHTLIATVSSEEGQTGLVRLETPIPKSTLVPHRFPAELPNLEPMGTRQKPLFVPPGLKNAALGKSVSGSAARLTRGELSFVTDGVKESTKSTYVELGPRKQWVQIDLEQETEIFGIWLWYTHHNIRAYVDVVIFVSNDEHFASGNEFTIYNNDHDGSSGLGIGHEKAYVATHRGRVIDAKGSKRRYVRLYSNGNTSDEYNQYVEVEVWGRPSSFTSSSNLSTR